MDNSYRNNDQDGLHVQSIERTHPPVNNPVNSYTPPAVSSPQSPPAWKQNTDTQKEYTQKAPQDSYYGVPPTYESTKQRRIPFGLSPWLFAAVIALITAVIVGGAVGGGVSAAMSSKKNCPVSSDNGSTPTGNAVRASGTVTITTTVGGSTPTSSSSATSTGQSSNYSPLPAARVQTLSNRCSDVDGRNVQSAQGSFFKVTCDQHVIGSQGASGLTIAQSLQYTLQDCINSCSLMNYWKGSNVCVGITWDASMAAAAASFGGGNCWLFNDVSNVGPYTNAVSAQLVK